MASREDKVSGSLEKWSRLVMALLGKELRRRKVKNPEQAKKVVEKVMKKAQALLTKVTKDNVKQTVSNMRETLQAMAERLEPVAEYRGLPLMPPNNVVRQYAEEAGKAMLALSRTKALSVLDPVTGVVIALPSAMERTIDQVDAAVLRGEADFQSAVRDAVRRLGGSGVRVTYQGTSRRLDTVARQAVLYETKQAAQAYSDEIGRQLGCDGFEVDWHFESRPSHVFMQGRQFALEGDQVVDGKVFPGAATTRDAESGKNVYESLDDYGCRHYKMPIILGVSVPNYTEEQLAQMNADAQRLVRVGDREQTAYEWSQAMRRLETATRKQKDIRAMAQATEDMELVRKCDQRIRLYREKYMEIAQATGIKPDLERMV